MLGQLGLAPHHRLGLLRACPEQQLTQPTKRSVLIFDQIGHVDVRLEHRANQREVLRVQRLLDAAEELLQLRAVDVDDFRRGFASCDYREKSKFTGLFAEVGSHRGLALMDQGFRDRARAIWGRDQACGPTGRQSGAAPVRVGLPAESSTAS